jgi:hypothetical protein
MSEKTPMWVGVTYLIYVFFVLGLLIGGTGYAVFALGHSGWWFLAAIGIGQGTYSPWRWHSIWTGVEVPHSRKFEEQ